MVDDRRGEGSFNDVKCFSDGLDKGFKESFSALNEVEGGKGGLGRENDVEEERTVKKKSGTRMEGITTF